MPERSPIPQVDKFMLHPACRPPLSITGAMPGPAP